MSERVLRVSETIMGSTPTVRVYEGNLSGPAADLRSGVRRSNLTWQNANVLAALLEFQSEESYGYEIARVCGSSPGSVYRALARLEDMGMVESRAEDAATARAYGRPVRNLFKVTENGEEVLARWRAEALLGSPASRLLA